MVLTFTSPDQNLLNKPVDNQNSNITLEDVDQQPVDRGMEYQVAALTDTTVPDVVPAVEYAEVDIIERPQVKGKRRTATDFQIENSVLDLIRRNYLKSGDRAADYLNFLTSKETLDEIILPNRNGQYTYFTGKDTPYTDPKDFSPRAYGIRNPFYRNPKALNSAMRRPQLKIADGNFPMLMQDPEAAPEDAKFIASEWETKRQPAELYWDGQKQKWKYQRTFGEQSLKDVEDIGTSIARGLVEMPNMAASLSYLANMGVSYGQYGVETVKKYLFDKLGISPTDEEAKKRLRENLEKGYFITVGSEDYAEFERQYAELTQPIRDKIGYFGPSEDKDYIDRFLEELFVMGLPLLGAGTVILKTGQSYARNIIKSQTQAVQIGKKLNVPIKPDSMLRVQDDILKTLKGDVDDKVIERIRIASPEERITLMKQYGVSDDLIKNYNLAEEAMRLQRFTSTPKSKRILDRYTTDYAPLAPEQTALSVRAEARRMAQSEIAATAAFTAGMEAFPDNPWISMGMGFVGAWGGGSGAYYIANRGPFKSVQSLRESKTIIPLTMDRLRSQKYSTFTMFSKFLGGNVSDAERQSYKLLGGESKFQKGPMSREDFYETLAANEVLKIFGIYDQYKNLSSTEKMVKARNIAGDRKQLDNLLKMESQARDWSINVPREELLRMSEFYQQQEKFITRINALLPEGEDIEPALSELFNLPTLAFLEKNLLDNINASMSFRLEQVPMLSDYTYILARKQESLNSLKNLLNKVGDLGVDEGGRSKLDVSSNKLVDDMSKYVDDVQDKLEISKEELGELIENKFSPHKKMLISPLQNQKTQDINIINEGIRVYEMGNDYILNRSIAYQNKRLEDVINVKTNQINASYDAIDFEHIIEDSNSIAGTLEKTIRQIENTADPTRSYTGARPASTRRILETARWRAISKDIEKLNPDEMLKYLEDLQNKITGKGIDVTVENNKILSGESIENFNRQIDGIRDSTDIEDDVADMLISQRVNKRLKSITRIDPSDTDVPFIKAKYSIKEFAKLRSHFSAQSVYASKGADRYTYRELAQELNDFMEEGSKSVTDKEHLTALKNANKVYENYQNLFGVGAAKKTMSKNEQRQRNFGVRYIDPADGDEASPNYPGAVEIISENEFMNYYTSPFFKPRARPDVLKRYAEQWKEIFADPNDGSFHQEDIDMLTQSFGYEAIIARGSKAVSSTERQAYENFNKYFGDIIGTYGGKKGETFLKVGDSYKRVKPTEMESWSIPQTEDIKNASLVQEAEGKKAVSLVNYILKKKGDKVKNTVFAQVAKTDLANLTQLRRIIFGGEGDTADIRFLRSTEMPKVDVKKIREEGILPTPVGEYSQRGVEALKEAGVSLDIAEASSPAQNFRQILDWAKEEGIQVIDGVKVNVLEETRNALKRILVKDMTETVIASTNKKAIIASPKSVLEGTNLLESKVDSVKFQQYLENNKAAFEELLGKEHTQVLEDIFRVTWTLGPDSAESTINGLFKGYTASNLQSLFWATARNVVSIRFVAGMLGLQAYRRGTTKYFEALLKDEKAAVILDKAFKSKKPPTREEMSAFKNVALFMFGPQVAARITQDNFMEERARIQEDMERTSLSDEEMQAMIQPKPQDAAGISDALRQYQGFTDEAGDILADPIREFANQDKLLQYGDIADEAIYRRSGPSVMDDVNTQMSNLNLN
tara:strand:- start:1070 stop:6127 length:5058 start_codon:yes stop_codon:yes gene_type:complete